MKKFFYSLLLLSTSFQAMAVAQVPEESTNIVEATEVAQGISSEDVMAIVIAVLILLAVLAIIGHMVYETFIRKKYRTDYSVKEFAEQRAALGLSPVMSDAEFDNIAEQLDSINNLWGEIPTDDGAVPYPLKKNHIKQALAILAAAEEAKPTNEAVVEKMNGLYEIINDAMTRSFNGSKAMIITAVIVGTLITLLSGTAAFAIMVGVSLLVYFFASRTPNFVLVRQELKGRSSRSFLTGVIGGLFAGVAASKTYVTKTKWSDGSETTETDNSETWISLIITLVVAVALTFFLWAIALINYLRNYILYF